MVMSKDSDQIVLIGEIKNCRNNSEREIITAILQLGIVKLAIIVNVPLDGEKSVKIYVKPAGSRTRDNYQPNRVADKVESRSVDDEVEYDEVGQ